MTYRPSHITLFVICLWLAHTNGYALDFFDHDKSESFQVVSPATDFSVKYFDGSALQGIYVQDTVQLGGMSGTTKFGGIQSYTFDWRNASGILGLGPSTDYITGYRRIPFSITTDFRFSLGLTETGGNLHLGSWNYPSVDYVSVLKKCYGETCGYNSYNIAVDSLRIGNQVMASGLTGIVDSGTTCIGISNQFNNTNLYTNVRDYVSAHYKESPSMFFTIGGKEYEVLFSDFVEQKGHTLTPCMFSFEPNEATVNSDLFLGDPFLRAVTALFDLRDPEQYKIGFTPRVRNSPQSLQQIDPNNAHHLPVSVNRPLVPARESTLFLPLSNDGSAPLYTDENKVVYTVDMAVGSNGQTFRIIVDTGSYLLAIVSTPISVTNDTLYIVIGITLTLSLLTVIGAIYYRRRRRMLVMERTYGMGIPIQGTYVQFDHPNVRVNEMRANGTIAQLPPPSVAV